MITITHASLRFDENIIFDQLSLTLKEQQWTAVLGTSGIGKTSLLKLIAGLIPSNKSQQATIQINKAMSLARDIAYLPQDDLLLPWLTVYENILIGSKLAKQKNDLRLRSKACELLEQVQLSHVKNAYPHELSGGMRQRVALARLLMQDKSIILLDEPFQALDAMTRFHLHNLACKLLQDKTVLLITHDLIEATRLAHEIYFMHGEPVQLTLAAELKTTIPREMTDPIVLQAQAQLYPLWVGETHDRP
jgi:putative hydroxymethylpyrimidine transport system ATP-binding protein